MNKTLAIAYGRLWCKFHKGLKLTKTYFVGNETYQQVLPNGKQLVAITATDDEHRIHKVFWELGK